MRIDGWQCFSDPARFEYDWQPADSRLPDDLGPILQAHRFDGSIALQATRADAELDWLLELADRCPLVRGVAGRRLVNHPKLRGVFAGAAEPAEIERRGLALVVEQAEAIPRGFGGPVVIRLDALGPEADLSGFPNVHVVIPGLLEQGRKYTAAELRPQVQRAFALRPPERLIYGSSWPMCRHAAGWKQVLAAFTQAHGPLANEIRNPILGENAARVFGLS